MFEPKTADASTDSSSSSPAPLSKAPAAMSMTYAQLLRHGCEYLEAEGMAGQQVKNLASALRVWVSTHGYVLEKIVAEEFGTDFDKYFTRFCDVIAERLTTRSQRDRQEQVIRWRRIAEALRRKDTLSAVFSEALNQCLNVSPLTRRQIARDSGMPVTTLAYWSSGRGQPRGEAVNQVPRLEVVLELPKGTLVSRLPLARRTRYQRGVEKNNTTTSFTKLRRAQMAKVGRYAMTFTPRLTAQWADLVRLKTDPLRDQARGRNTWRLKPIERCASHVSPAMVVDGQVCATAGVHWAFIASYLGWLKLPSPEGRGISADASDTLAWLADPVLVIAYANWRIKFSGRRFHNGVSVFLQLVESYLRPKTGFLWLRAEMQGTTPSLGMLGDTAGLEPSPVDDRWRSHCESARRKIREFRERAEDTMGVRLSRDPTERIAAVLHDEFPLKRLVEFIEVLERSAPPPAHHRDYCAWIRDVTLCRMLTANPLRASQYAVMTFRADGGGNLLRVGPGHYRLQFDSSDFKNEKGAAKKPYDVEVDPSVTPWIDRYLIESRPYLINAGDTDRFFLPAAVGPRKHKAFLDSHGMEEDRGWSAGGMLHRVKLLTSTYIDGCPGFGPHAFRHVIATDHLRRHPGDYLTVATLLHDKLETVLKNYGHLRVEDGLRVLSSGIREASSQLAAQRKKT